MYEIAKSIVDTQRESVKKAHNHRFKIGNMEYKIEYEGGIAEAFGVYGRKAGERNFRYITGFGGYKFNTKEQVIAMAKAMVAKRK